MRVTFSAITAMMLMVAISLKVEAATYSPILGDLLSGNTQTSAQGAQNPFNLYGPSFVKMGVSGVYTKNVAAANLNTTDTLSVISSFELLSDGINSSTTSALGGGGSLFGALIWSGEITNTGGSLTIGERTGGVGAITGMGSFGSDFLSVVVSDSVNFASSTFADINAGFGTSVIEVATFGLDADIAVVGGTAFGETTITASDFGVLNVSTTAPGTTWWTISSSGATVNPVTYPYGSFGSELLLNYGLGNNITSQLLSGSTTGDFTLGGNGVAAMNPVPEPGSLLAVAGCLGLAGLIRRRRKAA